MKKIKNKIENHLKWFEDSKWKDLVREYDEQDIEYSIDSFFKTIKDRVLRRASDIGRLEKEGTSYLHEYWKLDN